MSDVLRQLNTHRAGSTMTVVQGPCSHALCILYLDGPLRIPFSRQLRHKIRALLRRGTREIVLDLAGVSRIDAAGVGELIRAYNMTAAAKGVLRIARPTPWVRRILNGVGLLDPLGRGPRRRLVLLR